MRLDHLFTSLDSSRVCGQSTIALQNIQSSKDSSLQRNALGRSASKPHKRRSGGTPDTKFPGGHRSRVTPVPIPNTEVKPATADGTARAGGWESRSLPGINYTKPQCQRGLGFFFFPSSLVCIKDGLRSSGRISKLDHGTPIALSCMRNCPVSLILIVLIAALASACSDSPTSPSTASASSSASSSASVAAQLEGAWTLTSIQPAGQPRQDRPDDATYIVSFADGRLSTRADCNVCDGSFSISGLTLVAATRARVHARRMRDDGV